MGGTIFQAKDYDGGWFHAEIALPQGQISGYLKINKIVTPPAEISKILDDSKIERMKPI